MWRHLPSHFTFLPFIFSHLVYYPIISFHYFFPFTPTEHISARVRLHFPAHLPSSFLFVLADHHKIFARYQCSTTSLLALPLTCMLSGEVLVVKVDCKSSASQSFFNRPAQMADVISLGKTELREVVGG